MNKEPDRRPSADSPTPSVEATPSGPLDDSPKGDAPPRYTIANLEGWAGALLDLEAELDAYDDIAIGDGRREALRQAARFLRDTAGTLRAQARDRERRAARELIARRRARRRRGRGR